MPEYPYYPEDVTETVTVPLNVMKILNNRYIPLSAEKAGKAGARAEVVDALDTLFDVMDAAHIAVQAKLGISAPAPDRLRRGGRPRKYPRP